MKDITEKWIREDSEKSLTEIGIRKGQKVLDWGCGSGNYTIPIARIIGEEGLVYALDKDKKTLDELMERAKLIDLRNIQRTDTAGEPEIGLDNESVDVVLLYDVLHYYYFPRAEDRKRLLSEVYRVLKPNALLSLYPTHLQSYMEPKLEDVETEIKEANFYLETQYSGMVMLHSGNLENSQVMNFRKGNIRRE
ncbi:MAG TPA: class I SAM-dependent methyltransferase [Dehalococcoidia bacterium]|nr:class I SAM-dependent methyltransferase [Dehalococcoidia bacterium]